MSNIPVLSVKMIGRWQRSKKARSSKEQSCVKIKGEMKIQFEIAWCLCKCDSYIGTCMRKLSQEHRATYVHSLYILIVMCALYTYVPML